MSRRANIGKRRLLFIAFSFSIIILLAIIRFGPEICNAGTTIPEGIITVDTTWYASGSPFWIEGNVTVDSGVTLTIEAGVEARFNLDTSLIVKGRLVAAGTSSSMIHFTSNESVPQTAGYWRGLHFNSSANSIIKYSNISYGANGIFCNNSSLIVSNTNITSNINILGIEAGISLKKCFSVRIESSFVKGNNPAPDSSETGGSAFRIVNSSNISIVNSTIKGGKGADGFLDAGSGGDGIFILSSSNISIYNNTIKGGDAGDLTSGSAISSRGYAVDVSGVSNLTVSRSTITSGLSGINNDAPEVAIRLQSSSGEIINNSILGSGSEVGVYLLSSTSSIHLHNNTIANNGAGILLENGASPKIDSNIIINNDVGVWMSNAVTGNPFLTNNTIASLTYDFKLIGGYSHPTSLNDTFNKTSVNFDLGDKTSNLTVQWFMHVKVEDLNNKVVQGAVVDVKNINSVVIGSGITDAEGFLRWIVPTEYVQNDTNGDGDGEDPGEKMFFTPHNVTASKDGYTGYAIPEPNMNESKEVIVRLPVAYTTYSITKDPLQGNVTVDGLQYPAPAVFSWLDGDTHTISVDSPESAGANIQYAFDYWDDLGAQTHIVNVGTVDTVITAYYITQYRPTVTLIGTDSAHNVTAYYTQNGLPFNLPGNFNSWSEWCDGGTSLYFDMETTGSSTSERWHTYEDFAVNPWVSVSSAFSASVLYYHQYNATITTTGLISSYPAAITAIQAGNPINPTTYTSWNDWIDSTSTLSINETVNVSATERFHTVDIVSWTVNSPIDSSVNYYHQYIMNITTTGLDSASPATITVIQHGNVNNPTTSTSWADWVDNSTTAGINDTITMSGTERYHTIDSVSWLLDSTLSVQVDYYHQHKPVIIITGLDPVHNVTAFHVKDGVAHSDQSIFSSWTDWCDEGTSLTFDSEATGSSASERWYTYQDFAIAPWISVSSGFSTTVVYYHQYNTTITATGLISTYPATIIATQAGNPLNPTTYTSWNDWVDAGTALSVDETVVGSVTERYHTIDAFSWTINSPLDVIVNYYHQYLASISTAGLDVAYPSTISVVQHGSGGTPTTAGAWSDWVDASSILSISETISVSTTERYHTINTTTWAINSARTADVDYFHQYKPTIISNGLNSEHPAAVNYAQHGTKYSMTTSSTWTNWTDAGSDLIISDILNVSDRERYRTLDSTFWTADSAFTVTVNYNHQYRPVMSLVGTDSTHTVGVVHAQDTAYHNDTGVFTSWSDWVDENSTLSFDECTSGSPTRCTTDTRTWTIASALDATIRYAEDEVDSVKEMNYKPLVALIFCIILFLVGAYITNKKPLRLKSDEKRNKMFNLLFVVMPFVVIEAITGIVSLFTGLLSIPPIVGPGTIVDLSILIVGLLAFVLIYRKKNGAQD